MVNNQNKNQPQTSQSLPSTNGQKTDSAQPAVAPRPSSQQPILSGSARVRRDTQTVVDKKTAAPKVPSSESLNAPKSSTQAKAPETIKKNAPRPVRDTKPVETKKTPEPTTASKTVNTPSKSAVPAVPAKSVAPTKPVEKSNEQSVKSRQRRDAPNPHEQSKIVPSAHQTSTVDHKTTDLKTPTVVAASPSVIAKTPTSSIKRESPTPNTQQSFASTSYNQSPQFVHPVPVDQILKKPATTSSFIG